MKVFIVTTGYLFVLFTLIPFVRNDNWVFRIFEYPRFQKLVVSAVVLVIYLTFFEVTSRYDIIFVSLLTLNTAYLVYRIFPYTPVGKRQIFRKKKTDNANVFGMLIANVYQENRNVEALLREIERCNPELILVVEVDAHWDNALHVLHGRYPYHVRQPQENTYGISLYSRLELVDPKIDFLIKDDIPSIYTRIRLRSGELITLYGLHPEPPVPTENPRSAERDAEILTVAKKVQKERGAVIVAGDLNDVAWSYTTELFLKVSGLLDPRRGRGFYNTFHVKYPILRWPLDHVFCSQHFHLLSLKRLSNVGSDHFPIFISVQWNTIAEQEQTSNRMTVTESDEKLAHEKIQKV